MLVTICAVLFALVQQPSAPAIQPPVIASAAAPALQQQMRAEAPAELARQARLLGDPQRGAILFHQANLACGRCHRNGSGDPGLGPDLSRWTQPPTADHLIESILEPSKKIRDGYQGVALTLTDGRTRTGFLVRRDDQGVEIRDAGDASIVSVKNDAIEVVEPLSASLMPTGLVNQLTDRAQFLDLLRYVLDVVDFGPPRALELRPTSAILAPLPEYEAHVDHAGLIRGFDEDGFARGRAIYERLCINCHGTLTVPGSLPTSLRFGQGKFKSGSDPYSMYRTLTHGYGMMQPQRWMAPRQKYDVIHYIREQFLQQVNSTQFFEVTPEYLASLPAGDTQGPEPTSIEEWVNMNYGPNLNLTMEVGEDAKNFAYKGIAIRLDSGEGGVSRGRQWILYDEDTLRVAAAWSGASFMDYNAILFNGRHAVHPRLTGTITFQNATGPGWANPATDQFEDPRLRGRDRRPYGPLPRSWARYRGLYHYADRVVLSYDIDQIPVLESPAALQPDDPSHPPPPAFVRTLNIAPHTRPLSLLAAQEEEAVLHRLSEDDFRSVVALQRPTQPGVAALFDGANALQLGACDHIFDLKNQPYAILVKFKTDRDGTLFSCAPADGDWAPDGKTLFLRDGKLCFDIGWVGVVTAPNRLTDNRWHQAAAVFNPSDGQLRLFVDGKQAAAGSLAPKHATAGFVARVGYTSADFPSANNHFVGEISEVRLYQRAPSASELTTDATELADDHLVCLWQASDAQAAHIRNQRVAVEFEESPPASRGAPILLCGADGLPPGAKWVVRDAGRLTLQLPATQVETRLTIWCVGCPDLEQAGAYVQRIDRRPAANLKPLTNGGPRRWPQTLTTQPVIGNDVGPFGVDVLQDPTSNPWAARMRFTGFDFTADGRSAFICTWDGDVWRVDGLDALHQGLHWTRVASGLFQPLGLKIVDGLVYVGCRDQIVILRDVNGDGETDYYENFNNDHQVTEHFHEFAMGLQTDSGGNFYYAKSARHALPAVVPHHGTLLRVSHDGERTDILATGFRAANGVCLNPDGTFIVTDQEGHWNPKNRINWVHQGGFYGNMFGYHDVTDTRDSAMEQPLCWITNSFDRSPAELLWVGQNARWGPLRGALLNLSYGYGKIYIVPHESVQGQMQGGMCQLPLPSFPTGLIRARFHPIDGQLYTCGMFAWAGNQEQPGGFYRVRHTGQPVYLPIGLHADQGGLRITFSGSLRSVDSKDIQIRAWDLKRSANYGSPHLNEHSIAVTSAQVAADGRTVRIEAPAVEPTWCMEIQYVVTTDQGQRITGVIHNTIHHLNDSRPNDSPSSVR